MGFGVFEPPNRDLPTKVELSGPVAFRVGSAKAMINAAVIAMRVLFQIAECEGVIRTWYDAGTGRGIVRELSKHRKTPRLREGTVRDPLQTLGAVRFYYSFTGSQPFDAQLFVALKSV